MSKKISDKKSSDSAVAENADSAPVVETTEEKRGRGRRPVKPFPVDSALDKRGELAYSDEFGHFWRVPVNWESGVHGVLTQEQFATEALFLRWTADFRLRPKLVEARKALDEIQAEYGATASDAEALENGGIAVNREKQRFRKEADKLLSSPLLQALPAEERQKVLEALSSASK